jgi:hypothetical protein
MAEARRATRLLDSCTVGWRDFAWGDLWLFEDGLLRVSGGLGATLAQAGRIDWAYAPVDVVERDFTQEEIDVAVAADRRNCWIARDDIESAALHRGRLCDRLNVRFHDRRRIKLLWLKKRNMSAFAVLDDALKVWIRERLIHD